MKRMMMLGLLIGLISCSSKSIEPVEPEVMPSDTLVPARCYRIIHRKVVFFHCDSVPPRTDVERDAY